MVREVLTDRRLKALKPADQGKRYDIMDAVVPGLGIRVTDKGQRSFVLTARYPGSPNPTRRAIGEYGVLTLDKARETARGWHELIRKGIDPKDVEDRQQAAEQQKRANTVAAIAEDFIAYKLSAERKGREVENNIRAEFLPLWGKKPIADITDLDVLAVINAKKRSAPAQARNLLGIAKRFFGWAVDQRIYGLKVSPCDHLKPSKIIGEKVTGDRILSDDEIFALWRAADRMGYPYGAVYKLLLLTALRLNEVADGSWPEVDAANLIWAIPGTRMKGRPGKARAHAVLLTDDIVALLSTLPRFTGKNSGAFMFSTSLGVKPVWMSDKVKRRVDRRMLLTLRAMARRRGNEVSKVALPRWTNHDIRRSVRSNLSRLRIAEEAREALLAHARPGIKGTYDLHDYFDEKKEAMELWAARLRSIVSPAPANVVSLMRARP